MDDQLPLNERTILSAREVAQLIGRSLITLERWRRKKVGPPFIRMSGTRVGYPVDKLRRWQETGETSS